MGPVVLHDPPFSHRGKQQLRDGLSTFIGVTQLSTQVSTDLQSNL